MQLLNKLEIPQQIFFIYKLFSHYDFAASATAVDNVCCFFFFSGGSGSRPSIMSVKHGSIDSLLSQNDHEIQKTLNFTAKPTLFSEYDMKSISQASFCSRMQKERNEIRRNKGERNENIKYIKICIRQKKKKFNCSVLDTEIYMKKKKNVARYDWKCNKKCKRQF